MKDWELYEHQIFDYVKKNFKDAKYKKNAKIRGRLSKVQRQIDVLARGTIAGQKIRCAIECKHFSDEVNVKHVDSFIGFCLDIHVELGIMVTNNGFTPAAISRAKNSTVKVKTLTISDMPYDDIDWDLCEICEPDESLNLIDYGLPTKKGYIVGNCSWCNSLHAKCNKCGHIVDELAMERKPLPECFCGYKYYKRDSYAGQGLVDHEILRKK